VDVVTDSRTDEQLVTAARGGEDGAFAVLARRHRARAGALALTVLGDAWEAEDVVQEALLVSYRELEKLRVPGRFGAWLSGIALNLARMRSRARGRVRLVELVDGVASDGSPEQRLEAVELARLVRSALGTLPFGQREVVLQRYADGLSVREIARRANASPEAVRVRLYRARVRLRAALAELTYERREAVVMVAMEVNDVLVRGKPEPGALRVVLLRESEGERVLPIWIGAREGDALVLATGGERTPRPLTHDLTAALLEAGGVRVERVAVTSLRERTFYAVVRVTAGGRPEEVDARPSDALNLAVRTGAPILVDEEVLAQAAFPLDELVERLDAETREHFGGQAEGEWQTLSPDLVISHLPQP